MFNNIAKVHKKIFDKMVDSLQEEITLQFPPDKQTSTNARNKVYGQEGFESDTDEAKDQTVSAAVSGPSSMGDIRFSAGAPAVNMVGMLYESDLVLRLKLTEDILLDANKEFGRTVFDACRYVVVRNQQFKVKGVMRAGFPPLGPYGLYVGLVLAGE